MAYKGYTWANAILRGQNGVMALRHPITYGSTGIDVWTICPCQDAFVRRWDGRKGSMLSTEDAFSPLCNNGERELDATCSPGRFG